MSFAIRKIVVVGSGAMGQGIAQVTATAGYVTFHLYDVDAPRIAKAIERDRQERPDGSPRSRANASTRRGAR